MTVSIVDSTVLIHMLRSNQTAYAWFKAQPEKLSITTVTWMELMYGVRGKSGQANTKALLDEFEIHFLTQPDQEVAMEQMFNYRLSHGVAINDCLIASVCLRLQVPIYTHNVRHFQVLLDPKLVLRRYE